MPEEIIEKKFFCWGCGTVFKSTEDNPSCPMPLCKNLGKIEIHSGMTAEKLRVRSPMYFGTAGLPEFLKGGE